MMFVVGSDPRGTAYGILELSRKIGVSPWHFWADAVPDSKTSVTFPAPFFQMEKPSVQYRGIFLNDEDWGLIPWSTKTFVPNSHDGYLGPETYAKIYDLLLRLRANMIWPAMHPCTAAFYKCTGNMECASNYGIIVGTSHCEPMMRNNVGEWNSKIYGAYNFGTNSDSVMNYWRERILQTRNTECIYTMGMRGIHDGKMAGVKTVSENRDMLQKVINAQRRLLQTHVFPDIEKIPQVLTVYKEVQDAYDAGLNVPDDVTLIWTDDNFGNLRRLSNDKERERSGGSGVYYHISYWGSPHDYLWLYSTPPALMVSEMQKAYRYDARKLWILNVGDIKPCEYGITLFLDMAWDIDSVDSESLNRWSTEWHKTLFGSAYAAEITDIMNTYFHLAAIRKPEHLGWNRAEGSAAMLKLQDPEYNPFAFGDESQSRLNAYCHLESRVIALQRQIPQKLKDLFFQLIAYPVHASSLMNQKFLYAQKSRILAKYKLPAANFYAKKSRDAYNRIAELTKDYNQKISDGKWNGMMSMAPRGLPVFGRPILPDFVSADTVQNIVVWCDGDSAPLSDNAVIEIPCFETSQRHQDYLLSMFSTDGQPIDWRVLVQPEWLDIAAVPLENDESESGIRLFVGQHNCWFPSVDTGILEIGTTQYPFRVRYVVSPEMRAVYAFNGVAAWNAADFKTASAPVMPFSGLGHSGCAVPLNPGTLLAYDFTLTDSGAADVMVYGTNAFPVNGGEMRVAVSIDDGPFQTLSLTLKFKTEKWSEAVLRGQVRASFKHYFKTSGKHHLTIKALDHDIIVDQFMIDQVPERCYYEVPVIRK